MNERPERSAGAGARAVAFARRSEGGSDRRPGRLGAAARGWVVRNLFPHGGPSHEALLALLFELRPERWLRRMPGRETFPWPGHPDRIVKRIRGGEARDFWHDVLRRTRRSPARREGENLAALAADGFAVPRPLAWVEEAAARRHPRAEGRSALVMAHVGGEAGGRVADLRARLSSVSAMERRRLGVALAALVARLHARGWIHRDLYLQHLVPRTCTGGGTELVLLDVGRARRVRGLARERWLVKDLAALASSTPDVVTRSERLRVLVLWLRALGRDGRRSRRTWARRVLAKARRIDAHRPRGLDPDDPVDAELWLRAREP